MTRLDPPALDIEGLHVAFGDHPVLSDLNLAVPAQSLTAVLGSSGSGKTTLLRAIAGFERPTTGWIRMAGQVIEGPDRHPPPEKRRLGYVPQDGALFPHLTVAGNVGYGLSRLERRSSRVDQLLELVGLANLGRRYPHQLSGGQQQRVAVARALAVRPSLVLLDEPFAALDAALRARVRHEVVSILRGAATTVVIVTHDQQEALSLADQVAVLRDGHIAQVGSPGDLYARPIDPALAAFLGEANLVDATVVDGIAVSPLGPLRADEGGKGPVVAMVRPEQILLTPGHSPTGLRGHVLAVEFQGHDSMIIVASDVADHTAHVRVRIQGTAYTAPGDAVTLTANGTVPTWPRTLDPTRPPSSEPLSPPMD